MNSTKEKINSYRDLQVWQKGIEIADLTYALTGFFPDEERFGLVAQMQRAAVSIPSNIAEGFGRRSNRELIRFCQIALGSCAELETQLLIADKRAYFPKELFLKAEEQLASESKMLMGLIKSLRRVS